MFTCFMDDAVSEATPRRARRKRVLMVGVICDLSGTRLCDCTFLDISDEGARIRLSARCDIPAIFFLINVRGRRAYEAVSAWREDGQAGVRFARTIALTSICDPAHAFLCRIWLEAATG